MTPLIACSGPGAAAAIHQAIVVGFALTALTALFAFLPAIVSLIARRSPAWGTLWLLLFVAPHPGWWMPARGGDCGMMRTMGAMAWTAIAFLAIASVLLWVLVRKPSE